MAPILVTGGAGHLGAAVVERLLERGHDVRSFDLRPRSTEFDRSGRPGRVEHRVGDIRRADEVARAALGCDGVIHTAARIDLRLGRPPILDAVHVGGAANVIAACRAARIPRLVMMSSAEVISGTEPLRHADETTPYPAVQLTHYGRTKADAERMILAAADDHLGTCCLRTFGLFGPGDRTVIPRFLDRQVGRTIRPVSGPIGRTNVTFAPNLAAGLVLALERLEPGVPWSGQPLHLVDHEPVRLMTFLAELVEPFGYRFDDRIPVPRPALEALARGWERAHERTGWAGLAAAPITMHQLKLGLDDYHLDGSRLVELLDYRPPYERGEAVERTRDWLRSTGLGR